MLEFIFFNQTTRQRFVDLAQELGVETSVYNEEDSFSARLSEDIADNVLEQLEQHYDELMLIDQSLVEQDDEHDAQHSAGITIELKDGTNVYAKVPPELLVKVLQSISNEELNRIVNAIVEAVENPQQSSLCQRT